MAAEASFVCELCRSAFKSKIGLGVHRRRKHPVAANADVVLPSTKVRWSQEELRIMAKIEARATLDGERFMNLFLLEKMVGRTQESIKGVRRRADYKQMVVLFINELRDAQVSSRSNSSSSSRSVSPCFVPHNSQQASTNFDSVIRQQISSVMSLEPPVEFSNELVSLAQAALTNSLSDRDIVSWISSLNSYSKSRNVSKPAKVCGRKGHQTTNDVTYMSKKSQRRRDYAHIQSLWRKNAKRATHEVFCGSRVVCHDLDEMEAFWKPLLSKESLPFAGSGNYGVSSSAPLVWSPITVDDVVNHVVPISSAAGRDGISPSLWKTISPVVRALFYNVVLKYGHWPRKCLQSRTIFIPKTSRPSSPAEYRPISVASVVIRQLHKIFATRINSLNIFDPRQRAFFSCDGALENTTVLDAILSTAREELREVHVVTLDMEKAYDTISHKALSVLLKSRGFHPEFVQFVDSCYEKAETLLEVNRNTSHPIVVKRGVRQGDPLSPILFNLVMDYVLSEIPSDVGFSLGPVNVNALAFADDVVLVASSRIGIISAIKMVEDTAARIGLLVNPKKCSSLSLVPAGKSKKIKVVCDKPFKTSKGFIPCHGVTGRWSYLGAGFDAYGFAPLESTLEDLLVKVTKAPLKPQQRLHILRIFLIPKLYHSLILGKITLGRLKSLDIMVRKYIRRWLVLPHDVPEGFFHAAVKDGGLGVPSLKLLIPSLILRRLSKLEFSSFGPANVVFLSRRVQRRLRWARAVLVKFELNPDSPSVNQRRRYWAKRLYQSVDGKELRECSKSNLSTLWLENFHSMKIPGRDFIQYVHTRINTLPTRIRVSRGELRTMKNPYCRAGCPSTETAAHIIQNCWRTHGGRVKRHNAIMDALFNALTLKRWKVVKEPHISTTCGLRKPDLIMERDGKAVIVDVQVVSGVVPLIKSHGTKVKYYRDNPEVVGYVAEKFGVESAAVGVTSCTISWRGVWCVASDHDMRVLSLKKNFLSSLTTRVLQGSHTNWTRFNKMTAVRGFCSDG